MDNLALIRFRMICGSRWLPLTAWDVTPSLLSMALCRDWRDHLDMALTPRRFPPPWSIGPDAVTGL
jgi:hypothetical protein